MPASEVPTTGDVPGAGADGPVIRVIRGTPTTAELAALIGALLSRSRPASVAPPSTDPSPWTMSARPGGSAADNLLSRPGPDAWRRSGLPR